MKFRFFLMTFMGFALCLSIAAQKVSYETAPGVDFSKFKTYKWERADARYPDDATDAILVSSIDEQLAAKGLVKTVGETADLFVVYQLATLDQMPTSSFKTGGAWLGVPDGGNPGFNGVNTNNTEVVKKGWLLIDLYDASQKKLVWRASSTKSLKGKGPDQIRKNTKKAMSKVFTNYPPKS